MIYNYDESKAKYKLGAQVLKEYVGDLPQDELNKILTAPCDEEDAQIRQVFPVQIELRGTKVSIERGKTRYEYPDTMLFPFGKETRFRRGFHGAGCLGVAVLLCMFLIISVDFFSTVAFQTMNLWGVSSFVVTFLGLFYFFTALSVYYIFKDIVNYYRQLYSTPKYMFPYANEVTKINVSASLFACFPMFSLFGFVAYMTIVYNSDLTTFIFFLVYMIFLVGLILGGTLLKYKREKRDKETLLDYILCKYHKTTDNQERHAWHDVFVMVKGTPVFEWGIVIKIVTVGTLLSSIISFLVG
jgi:hypothetical protein